jgi:large subunit ribosomal protein L21
MASPIQKEGHETMYAIFETGGKQYKVSAGDVIRIEKIEGGEGDEVRLGNVILFSDGSGALQAGTPYLDATVNAAITGAGKADKVIIFKFKPKKGYRKKQGHRQPYTEIEIGNFTVGGKDFGEKPEKPTIKEDEKTEDAEAADAEAETGGADEAVAAEKAEAPAEAAEAKAAPKMTKADITAKLDGLGVDYAKGAKKDELLALLDEAESK